MTYGGIRLTFSLLNKQRAGPKVGEGRVYVAEAEGALRDLTQSQCELINTMNPTYLSTVKEILRQ